MEPVADMTITCRRVEPVTNFAQRFRRHRLGMKHIDTCIDPLDGLNLQSLLVAATGFVEDGVNALVAQIKGFQ